jgi:hypothetical protein
MLLLGLVKTHLERLVPIAGLVFLLNNHAWTRFDNRANVLTAIFREIADHSDLLSNNAFHR